MARTAKLAAPTAIGPVVELLIHFALVYGSDFVIDKRNGRQMRVNALRHIYGIKVVKAWLEHPDKMLVLPENIVFDPSETCGPECVNLWRGFEVEALADGQCAPLIELLMHLCSGPGMSPEDVCAAMDYVLDWLAYPLQNPGAKLSSALVFHGPQGTGKNLFFEVMARIYGRYGLVVGQDQLEDKFNDWASQKLFLIGDEVVARQELYHHKNKLKAFITGTTIQINTKMLPLRTEANHMNIVFLSNELQPLALEEGDRRYFVVWCPEKGAKSLYDEAAEGVEHGGAEALFHLLLQRDLSGFSPHAAPPMTAAKRDLVDLGLRPADRFMREWQAGTTPLPLRVCSSEQLYRAFRRWCLIEGERFPPPHAVFSKTATKFGHGWIQLRVVALESTTSARKSVRCWLPAGADAPPGESLGRWAAESVAAFDDDLVAYCAAVGAGAP